MKMTKTGWLVSGGVLVTCTIALHHSLKDKTIFTAPSPQNVVTDKSGKPETSTNDVPNERQGATAMALSPSGAEPSEELEILKDQVRDYEQIIASQDIYKRLNDKSLPESERMSLTQIVKDRDASVDKLIKLSEEKLRRMSSMR